MNMCKLTLVALFLCTFILSCSQGIFNFNEDTGNIKIEFTVDSDVTDYPSRITCDFSNNSSGAQISESMSITEYDGVYRADKTIYRVDSGSWDFTASLVNSSNDTMVSYSGSFSVQNDNTTTMELTYNSSGYIESSINENSVGLITLNNFESIITASHYSGNSSSNVVYSVITAATGSGFYSGIDTIKIEYPDSSSFEYSPVTYRSSNFYIDIQSEFLSLRREGYDNNGNYQITIKDLNGVEYSGESYCYYGYTSSGGFALLTGSYQDGDSYLLSSDFTANGTPSTGCYVVYIVNSNSSETVYSDSTNGVFNVVSPSEDQIALYTTEEAYDAGSCLLVLATLDAVITDSALEAAFTASTSVNMYPDSFVNWLIINFPD
ncbi:MAG: hypothetical protein PQJ46_05605, partial [Spirochaetales bacterium]|nr:hypothetical protein [Spirochaetales bacterium]